MALETQMISSRLLLQSASIGDVIFGSGPSGVRASSLGLHFRSVDGPWRVEAQRGSLEIQGAHGVRGIGRNRMSARRITFNFPDWRLVKSRERMLIRREQIFDQIVRPALEDEIEIHFEQTKRSIWGHIEDSPFGDGLASLPELARFFTIGLTFQCFDPIIYGPYFKDVVPIVAGQRIVQQLGHLDSFIEFELSNPSTTAIAGPKVLELTDENSGRSFRFLFSVKILPGKTSLHFNSFTSQVYFRDHVTGSLNHDISDAVVNLPLPMLTRTSKPESALVVTAAPTGIANLTGWLRYRPRYIVV